MNALSAPAPLPDQASGLRLVPVAAFPGLRVLTWSGEFLYASRGYELLRARIAPGQTSFPGQMWEDVAVFRPPWWRNLTAATRLSGRLVRDGFHALAVLPSGGLVAAVPGAIITLRPGARDFLITHNITRGTRPLHITAAPNGTIFWGEYFNNPSREEVHVYASPDDGMTWAVAYTFPRRSIRHVHNIVHDPWQDCLWVLTGDYGEECRILRASCDFRVVEVAMSGNQQARAVALVPAEDGLYFSSDTPLEANHIYHLDRQRGLIELARLSGSSIYGCRVGDAIFFSTMVEPSRVNPDCRVRVYGSSRGMDWGSMLAWRKDAWPMRFFQYGNAFLPDGNNAGPFLALTTVAVKSEDMQTSLYSVQK